MFLDVVYIAIMVCVIGMHIGIIWTIFIEDTPANILKDVSIALFSMVQCGAVISWFYFTLSAKL